MLKIFELETINYLKECKISEREIARISHRELKKAVLKTLNNIVRLIEKEEYDKISAFLAYSPAGDDMGSNNNYIDFNDIATINEYNGTDIKDIITILIEKKRESNDNK